MLLLYLAKWKVFSAITRQNGQNCTKQLSLLAHSVGVVYDSSKRWLIIKVINASLSQNHHSVHRRPYRTLRETTTPLMNGMAATMSQWPWRRAQVWRCPLPTRRSTTPNLSFFRSRWFNLPRLRFLGFCQEIFNKWLARQSGQDNQSFWVILSESRSYRTPL